MMIILGVALVTGTALAGDTQPASHSPEWTDHNDSDPGVTRARKKASQKVASEPETTDSTMPELSEIVVLCATDEKKKFEKEWGKYVAKNELKGEQLEKTIREVSDRAEAYREKEFAGKEKNAAWKEERRRLMSEVAEKVLAPIPY